MVLGGRFSRPTLGRVVFSGLELRILIGPWEVDIVGSCPLLFNVSKLRRFYVVLVRLLVEKLFYSLGTLG